MKSEPAGEQRLCLCDPPFEGRAILHLRFGGRCQSAERAQCPHSIPNDPIPQPSVLTPSQMTNSPSPVSPLCSCYPQGRAVLVVGQHLVEGIKARCPCPPSKGWHSLAAGLCFGPAKAPGIATKMRHFQTREQMSWTGCSDHISGF